MGIGADVGETGAAGTDTNLGRGYQGGLVEIDYSPFLHVLQDGTIWWPLTDAVKLGAGYVPLRDEDRNLDPVLIARNNQVRVNERTLFGEFSQDHYTQAHPRLVERDGGRYVEAHEFLNWLSRYLAAQTPSEIKFPHDLARAVKKATKAPVAHAAAAASFESITLALEGSFDLPLAELPVALRQRVEDVLRWHTLGQPFGRTAPKRGIATGLSA